MSRKTSQWSIEVRTNIAFITVFAFAIAANGAAADPTAKQFEFKQYDITTDITGRPSVLTGSLLGNAMSEIAIAHINENDERALRVYAFDGEGWSSKLDAKLPAETLFVDIANFRDRDRLIAYEPGHLNWFDPETATVHPLVAVSSYFDPPHEDEIPHVDITHDLNGDHRDDLVVPDVDGFWVFVQTADGTFADPVKIGPPTDLRRILGADGYRYDPWSESRVFEVDFDRDGRVDLVFWNEDHFEVHAQNERGQFDPDAKSFTTEVAFDSDRLDTLIDDDMTGTVLHTLTNLNGDGVADLVVYALTGSKISSKRSAYSVHFGAPSADGGTAFATEAGTVFKSKNSIQLGMELDDFDGDGDLDMMSENTFRDLPILVGIPGPELFAQQPQIVPVVIPHDREYSWLADLNRDGIQDIVMHHPFTKRDIHGGRIQPPGTEPHRVVVLIAQ